jgi:hypothetical protein
MKRVATCPLSPLTATGAIPILTRWQGGDKRGAIGDSFSLTRSATPA